MRCLKNVRPTISTSSTRFLSPRQLISSLIVVLVRQRQASTFVASFDNAVDSIPHREAVRYTAKNMKWSASELKSHINAHANAFLSHKFAAGEKIGMWLPDSAEKHVAMLAAAKVGLQVVEVNPNDIKTVADLRQYLTLSQCKALYFEATSETQDNLLLLRKSIPEFFDYDDTHGQSFHSKYWPALSLFIHTGFDIERGCLNYSTISAKNVSPHKLEAAQSALNDATPVFTRIVKGQDGKLTAEATLSHGQLLNSSSWVFAKNFVNNQYFETA